MAKFQHEGKTYIDLAEMAEQSGYDPGHLERLARSGDIDAVYAHWLINPESLKAYVEAKPQRKPRGDKRTLRKRQKRGSRSAI